MDTHTIRDSPTTLIKWVSSSTNNPKKDFSLALMPSLLSTSFHPLPSRDLMALRKMVSNNIRHQRGLVTT
jgi:hypothetical protein